MSNMLNDNIVSVLTNELQPFEMINFRDNKVQEQLNKLNIYQSTGPGDLHSRILINLFEIISSPMTFIFNRSMVAGSIPVD